jgi:hypothetical protein
MRPRRHVQLLNTGPRKHVRRSCDREDTVSGKSICALTRRFCPSGSHPNLKCKRAKFRVINKIGEIKD